MRIRLVDLPINWVLFNSDDFWGLLESRLKSSKGYLDTASMEVEFESIAAYHWFVLRWS